MSLASCLRCPAMCPTRLNCFKQKQTSCTSSIRRLSSSLSSNIVFLCFGLLSPVSCLTSPVLHLLSQVSRLLSHFSCRRSPDALPVLHLKGQIVKFSDCSKFLVFLFFKYYPRSELLLWLHWSYCVAIVPGAQTVHLFE